MPSFWSPIFSVFGGNISKNRIKLGKVSTNIELYDGLAQIFLSQSTISWYIVGSTLYKDVRRVDLI